MPRPAGLCPPVLLCWWEKPTQGSVSSQWAGGSWPQGCLARVNVCSVASSGTLAVPRGLLPHLTVSDVSCVSSLSHRYRSPVSLSSSENIDSKLKLGSDGVQTANRLVVSRRTCVSEFGQVG